MLSASEREALNAIKARGGVDLTTARVLGVTPPVRARLKAGGYLTSSKVDNATFFQVSEAGLLALHKATAQDVRSDSEVSTVSTAESDEAIARALQDQRLLLASINAAKMALSNTEPATGQRLANAANLVLQWIRQAADRRGIRIEHNVDLEVSYDPALHDCEGRISTGRPVVIQTPVIVRGNGPSRLVLLRGRVKAI
jgi:hypothetical protein